MRERNLGNLVLDVEVGHSSFKVSVKFWNFWIIFFLVGILEKPNEEKKLLCVRCLEIWNECWMVSRLMNVGSIDVSLVKLVLDGELEILLCVCM